jgi:hypothetical protein
MDNGRQSFPKVSYGLAGYRRAFATIRCSGGLNVARHGAVEFHKVKTIREPSDRLDVVINPTWDLGRAARCTSYASNRALCSRFPKFYKVQRKEFPNAFVVLEEFVERSTWQAGIKSSILSKSSTVIECCNIIFLAV